MHGHPSDLLGSIGAVTLRTGPWAVGAAQREDAVPARGVLRGLEHPGDRVTAQAGIMSAHMSLLLLQKYHLSPVFPAPSPWGRSVLHFHIKA